MDRGARRSLPLFDDDHFLESDEILRLREALMLDLIQKCQSLDSMQSLRQFIAEIKRRVLTPDDELRADVSDAQTVEFNRNYLISDLDQISASLTVERARYYIDRLLRSISEVKTSPVNDINLNRWKEYDDIYTDSLWVIDRRDSSGVHTAGYWGNFIPQIPYQMMRRYESRPNT